jgi:C1A family cysteine protease
MQGLNKIRYYAWAFGLNDVLQTLMRKGPVILGINWYDSMYETSLDGLVTVGGPLVGGHCIMVNGYIPNHPSFGECVLWTNSWGREYGVNGRGYVKVSDLDRLLKEDGEACIPTDMPVRL